MPPSQLPLSPSQVLQFEREGYCVLRQAFSRDFAAEHVTRAFGRQGQDQADSATWAEFDRYRYSDEFTAANQWEQGRTHLPCIHRWRMRAEAPRAFAAVEQLLGVGRAAEPYFSDGFVINYNSHLPYQPPSTGGVLGGWHKDGDWYRQFLDGPEQVRVARQFFQSAGILPLALRHAVSYLCMPCG